jgi:hypothetical protein
VDSPREECGDDKAVTFQFPVDSHKILARLQLPYGQAFAGVPQQNPLGIVNCRQHLLPQAGQFGVLLCDVRPPLVG